MCGRITQLRYRKDYGDAIGFDTSDHLLWTGGTIPQYNVTPGRWPWVLHRLYEGKEALDTVHWGYWPSWAKEKGIPQTINARIEKAATGRYFRHMWREGRVIVPADGWYEWTGEKGHKQPWYIRLKTDKPMFMAGITNWKPYYFRTYGKEEPEGTGFVIVTAAAEEGLIDVHDRRPVVLAKEEAQLWLDPDLPADQAENIARNLSLPPEAFEWYKVSTAVNKAGNNDPSMIEPIEAKGSPALLEPAPSRSAKKTSSRARAMPVPTLPDCRRTRARRPQKSVAAASSTRGLS